MRSHIVIPSLLVAAALLPAACTPAAPSAPAPVAAAHHALGTDRGGACSDASQCASGFCVEGVCCDSACSDPNSCDHCAVARGADVDGVCTKAAERPRSVVDTSQPPSGLVVRPLGDDEDLQAVLDASGPGVEIVVPSYRTFTAITLPARDPGNTTWTVIRSGDPALPPAGQRVAAADAPALPKLRAAVKQPAVMTAPGASYFWIAGFEVTPVDANTRQGALVLLGDPNGASVQADHIVLDRLYIHGYPGWGSEVSGGVSAHGSNIAVINSHISEIHTLYSAGCTGGCTEAMGFVSWNGPGPYRIANDYIAASSHNIFFGGAPATSEAMAPADVEIVGNHLHKPLSWYVGNSTPRWQTKTLLEMKTARRVLIEGNYFENEWNSAGTSSQPQVGEAIVLSPRNGDDVTSAPWSTVRDIAIRNNKVVNAARGIGMAAQDDRAGVVSGQTRCVDVVHNLFDRLPGTMAPGDGRFMTLLGGPTYGVDNVRVEHNTVMTEGQLVMAGTIDGSVIPNRGFVFRNNLSRSLLGIVGDGRGEGTNAFSAYYPDIAFSRNDMIGGNAAKYGTCGDYGDPSCSFFTPDVSAVAFEDLPNDDLRLLSGAPDDNECTHAFNGGAPHAIGVYDWSGAGVGQADAARHASEMDQ